MQRGEVLVAVLCWVGAVGFVCVSVCVGKDVCMYVFCLIYIVV